MTSVSHIAKSTEREVEGDWDTGIDYREHVITRNKIEFKVEDILCNFEITIIESTARSYIENEESGGYGPEMERNPGVDTISTYATFEAGFDKGFSFDPESDVLYKQLVNMEEGEEAYDLHVPMRHYMCVSSYRWGNTLDSILNNPALDAEFL